MASALIAQSPTIATANTAASNIQLAAFICSSPHSLSRTASRRPLFASTQHIYAPPLLPPLPAGGEGWGEWVLPRSPRRSSLTPRRGPPTLPLRRGREGRNAGKSTRLSRSIYESVYGHPLRTPYAFLQTAYTPITIL